MSNLAPVQRNNLCEWFKNPASVFALHANTCGGMKVMRQAFYNFALPCLAYMYVLSPNPVFSHV
jgi:hypothetical protein